REMTNSAGSSVWQQSFDPYGVPATIVGTTPSDFGFAGMYVHQRSGLNLTLFRAYSAGLGRWLTRDPVSDPDLPNDYVYVKDDPIAFRDELGLQRRISYCYSESCCWTQRKKCRWSCLAGALALASVGIFNTAGWQGCKKCCDDRYADCNTAVSTTKT